jgi:hypothetical protein
MKSTEEMEKERRFEQAEERYTREREDVPIPGKEKTLRAVARTTTKVPANRSAKTKHPLLEVKEPFSEALSQFEPINDAPKSARYGRSKVKGIDQTSPGVEDARGANRLGRKKL